MKKIFKNKIALILVITIIALLIVFLIFFIKGNKNIVTRVDKILKPEYYGIECINNDCKYMVAYEGKAKGKTTVRIINSDGKTVVKYKTDNSKELVNYPVNATNKYVIVALRDKKNYTHGYAVYNSKGKRVHKNEKETLYPITDKYFYGKNNDLYTIYDYKGNAVFKDTKDLRFYNDNKIITFETDKLNIIDNKSNRILDDYRIEEEIIKNDKTLYLIVKDNNGVYFYFDVNKNKIVGDSFNSYTVLSDKKLIISKKVNNGIKKYVLDTNGKVEKEIKTNKNYTKDVLAGYTVIDDSVVSGNQKGLLVYFGNSYGTFDLKTEEFTKIADFKDNNKHVETYNIFNDLDEIRIQVGCSKTYCNEKFITVYDPINNSIVLNVTSNEKDIKKYREYKNGYVVLTYTDDTHTLYNNKGEKLYDSISNIVVVGQDILVDDNSNSSNVLLYSIKDKKMLNDENSLALLDDTSNYDLYRVFDEKNLYLYNSDGKLLNKVAVKDSNIVLGDKYYLFSGKKIIDVYSLMDNSKSTIKLLANESITTADGANIAPNKGQIIVSDYKNDVIRVKNIKNRTLRKIKKSEVFYVSFDKENNSSFMIVKSNKKYGLYIIK